MALEEAVRARVDELVQELVGQVKAEARKYYLRAPHALERDELEGIGNNALVWASANWGRYCEQYGYDPAATHYFRAYALRRIRGAILDSLRAQDWVPRAVRSRHKEIQRAEEKVGTGEAALSAETELTVPVIRQTMAAVARRPVSLDERTEDIPDCSGVEALAVAGSVLDAIGRARELLPVPVQAVLALRYYQHKEIPEIAAVLELPEAEVQEMHDNGILAVHQAMLGAVA